ncbi:sigma-54-dependent transcriptional regulator [Hymenobacter setariae]|uniref:sigma-54-dependent transcriptional regulator n=1 Tax=Hymenobacter setariae TaxID=2594794 RepID=UPI001F268FF1|nr:sigma-54 dependent transcriptional regulator [Hymenobacter setariae]
MGRNPDYRIRRFPTIALALGSAQEGEQPEAIIYDCGPTPDAAVHRAVRQLREQLPQTGLFLISSQSDISTAVELMRHGASDYLVKDASTPDRLWQLLAQTCQPRATPPSPKGTCPEAASLLLGEHASMQRVRELIAKAARTVITVSITGETGTGKELVAQAIHAQSSRASQPFVAVNMAAIPRELLESELFGHEKGAFTGATARRVGHFEAANGGTLFLDEIGDLELPLQAKLLRVLQERVVTRVGGSKPVPFDVRLVVATHRDLAAEARAGRFREDLYYRLLGLPIELPPLRARGNDRLLLADHFVQNFSHANRLPIRSFDAEAKRRLLAYPFPGNVRELKAVVELAAVLADGAHIVAADLPPLQAPATGRDASAMPTTTGTMPSLREQTLAIMQNALLQTQGDVVAAASRLRIGRSTMYRLLQSGHLRLPQD